MGEDNWFENLRNEMYASAPVSVKVKQDAEDEKIELINELSTNPIYFIEVFLERQLSPKQRFFLDATKTKNHIVAIWSRQTGKSTVIASYILWRLLYGAGTVTNGEKMPEHIAIVAPIKDQIRNLYEKIKVLIDKSDFIASYIKKMNTEVIITKDGNEARFFSASPGSQIRGYTATCIVIDESQDVTDSKYSADVLPFGATTNALVIEAGTPKTKNHFYNAMNNKNILVIKQPWFECPFLSEDYVMSQKAISPGALWRQEYLCEFVEEGVMAFPSVLFEPETKHKVMTGRWNLADYPYLSKIHELTREKTISVTDDITNHNAAFTFGLDLGKQNDNTVFTILRTDVRPIRVEASIKFELDTDYTLIAKQIAMFYRVYQPHEFNFDYSNEKMFLEALLDAGVNVAHTSANDRGAVAFTNKNKTEMVTTARVLLENYQLQLPKSAEMLISQFLNQQFEITEQGLYKYFHPSNEHDDALWSLLLALKLEHIEDGSLTSASVSFVNPWEKQDDIVHKNSKIPTSEVLVTNKRLRTSGRYESASSRRRSASYTR